MNTEQTSKNIFMYNLIFIYFVSYELVFFDSSLPIIFLYSFSYFFNLSLFSLIRIIIKYLFPLISLMYPFFLLLINYKGFALFGLTYPMQYITLFFYNFLSTLMLSGLRSVILIVPQKVVSMVLDLIYLTLSICVLVLKYQHISINHR